MFESSFLAIEDACLNVCTKRTLLVPSFCEIDERNEPHRSAILSIGKQNLTRNVLSLTVEQEQVKWETCAQAYKSKEDEGKCQLKRSLASAVLFRSSSLFLFVPI
jgi:hypothetical protein